MKIFKKLEYVFNKEPMSKEEFGKDGYMLLRFLSMKPEYTMAINNIQKYQGTLGHRLMILLQHMFAESDKVPYLDYVKKEETVQRSLSPDSINILKKLFNVSRQRLEEYLPNIWVTDEEIKTIWGLQ